MKVKRDCKTPRSKEGQFRNQDNTRKQGNNKDTSSKAMLAIDGIGFDWSDMAEEQVKTTHGSNGVSRHRGTSKEMRQDWHCNAKFGKDASYLDFTPRMLIRELKSAIDEQKFTRAVNTAKAQAVNTARPKVVKTARPNYAVVNVVRVNQANAVKALACWVWRPAKPDSGKLQQDDTEFVDSGCSRHMTGNIAYLLDFKEFDGGYVVFGGGSHGGRILGKGLVLHVKKGRETKIPQSSGPPVKVGDEAIHKELGDRIERAATTASSLEVESDLHLEDAGGTDCLPTTTIFEKLEDDKEIDEHEEVEADDTTKLKKYLVIKKDDDITIDVIPLATKPPVIVDYKLLKKELLRI
ncbi:hypothetical protein Tco_0743631, partial [Tanacetum coccineum]